MKLTVAAVAILLLSTTACSHVPSVASRAEDRFEPRTGAVGTIEVVVLPEGVVDVVAGNGALIKPERGSKPGEALLIFLRRGVTTVDLVRADGTRAERRLYNVITNEHAQQLGTITKLLRSVSGITVRAEGEFIVADGMVASAADLDRVAVVGEAFATSFVNLVRLDPAAYARAAREMEAAINGGLEYGKVEVELRGEVFFLSGHVSSQAERVWVEAVAQAYLPARAARVARREGAMMAYRPQYLIHNFVKMEAADVRAPASER